MPGDSMTPAVSPVLLELGNATAQHFEIAVAALQISLLLVQQFD